MNGALRGSVLAAIVFMMALTSFVTIADVTRDEPGNDSFSTATPLVYTTEVQSGTLDATDTVDFYLLQDLVGDTVNDQMGSQIIEIKVRSSSGDDVLALVYEPNRLAIGEIRSSGEWGGVKFVVPYDGDYYLSIATDPSGGSSTYEMMLGGELGYDNRPYTKNNQPNEFVFTQSRKVSLTLNPVKNIVDYYSIDLPPGWGLEAMFESDYPMHLTLLDSTFGSYGEAASTEPLEVRSNGEAPLPVHVRINYPLDGSLPYDQSNKPYDLHLVVWCFETVPVIQEEWPEVITLDEDPLDPLVLNLSQHFKEASGDLLSFEVLSVNSGLSVRLNNVTTSYGDPLYTEAIVMPPKDWFGEEGISFACSDRDLTVEDGMMVKVDSVNDLPFVTRIGKALYEGGVFYLGVPEDEVRVYTLEYGDVDDNASLISFSIDRTIRFLDVAPSNGTIRASPRQEDVGYYEFDLVVLDPSGGSIEVPINLTVLPVNDPPFAPDWTVISGNLTSILPGETISLRASSRADPDGDLLSFTWEWGDGTTTEGEVGTHVYGPGLYGHRTIKLISYDGNLQNGTEIPIYLRSPEDIAIGDLKRTVNDASNDVVEFREEWSANDPERKFRMLVSTDQGCDIVSVRTVRRTNEMQVYMTVAGMIGTDGQYQYNVFIMDPSWSEVALDQNVTTRWDLIPSFVPDGRVISRASYLGALDVNSTGTILEGDTLLFTFDIMSMNRSGLTLPLNRSGILVFCYAQLTIAERSTGRVSMRSVSYDSAGDGACIAPEVKPPSTRGGGSSTIGDLAEGPGLFVMIALVVLLIVLGTVGFVLVGRERRKKREEEARFVEDVERMRAEGRDLFDRVKEEGPKKVSYKELYGQAPPKDYKADSDVKVPPLPGPGLAGAGVGQGPPSTPEAEGFMVAKPNVPGTVDWEE